MRIQYILHAEFERPGIIETWAQENQFEQLFCRPFAGEKTPSPGDYDLLILMGGPQSPLKPKEFPYLLKEIDLVKTSLQKQIPVLGFCLGAQIIGEAFGAKTERSPHKEVGVFPIQVTEEGRKDPLLSGLPETFPVTHWHNDMPGLTKDSKILAYSEGCPRQIVRYSAMAYGFQCHPEITKKNIEGMIPYCLEDLAPGKYVQSEKQLLANDYQSINAKMILILEQFCLENSLN